MTVWSVLIVSKRPLTFKRVHHSLLFIYKRCNKLPSESEVFIILMFNYYVFCYDYTSFCYNYREVASNEPLSKFYVHNVSCQIKKSLTRGTFDRHFQALSNALCVFILFVSEIKENIP